MEDGDGIETAQARQKEQVSKGAVEKKAVMLIRELRRCSVFVAAVSETKWFGNNS